MLLLYDDSTLKQERESGVGMNLIPDMFVIIYNHNHNQKTMKDLGFFFS